MYKWQTYLPYPTKSIIYNATLLCALAYPKEYGAYDVILSI
jgi:hypothetical protein